MVEKLISTSMAKERTDINRKTNYDELIQEIQAQVFKLDEKELKNVLNRLINEAVSLGRSKLTIDDNMLFEQFKEDGRMTAFVCRWEELKNDIQEKMDCPFLNYDGFLNRLKKRLEWKRAGSFTFSNNDKRYMNYMYYYEGPLPGILLDGRFAPYCSNSQRYITLAEKILRKKGYAVKRPKHFWCYSELKIKW